jgi:hypothetical protein
VAGAASRDRRGAVAVRRGGHRGAPRAIGGSARRAAHRHPDTPGAAVRGTARPPRHFERRVDGQNWLDEQTAALVTGTHVAPKTAKMLVGEWCDTWLEGYAARRSSTVRQARVHIRQIKAEFGGMRLSVVRPSHVKAWCAKLRREDGENGKPRYFASLLIANGTEVKIVQARLRHGSAKTTLDTYGHIWPDRDESTRATVDAVLTAYLTEQRRNSATGQP